VKLIIAEQREGWITLRRAIPDGTAKAVALRLHLHPDHVRRWRREPLSDDAPLSSGQRSPLDRVCDLIDAVFLSNPVGPAYIVEHVRRHYDALLDAQVPDEAWDRRQHAAELLRETVDAVNCLNLEADDDETISEIIQARDSLDRALAQIKGRRTSLLGESEGTQGSPEPARSGVRAGSGGRGA
jgi:hypothetical protein